MSAKEQKIFNAFKVTEDAWKKRIAASDIPDHPGTKGDVAENSWRELLSTYLPARYKVNHGFVVDCEGKHSDQIDCIIYDNTFTPTFFAEHGIYYIPAEAVYAVFEIKQVVTAAHIKYASEKTASVRSLRRTSAPYTGDGQPKTPKNLFPIIAGLMARKIKASTWSAHVKSLNSIQNENPARFLDIVLTAESGSIDYFQTGFPTDGPKIHSPECGLILGILRLVQALQRQGTVPAIDWNEWLSNLKP